MNSAAAAFTWPCWASISAGIASRRMCAAAMTSLPTFSGYFDRREERDAATERVADDVRLVEPEVVDERRDVVGHEPDVDRAIDVGRPAVTLEVDRDDLVVRGEGGQDRPEHLARAEPAVEQDQRPAAAVRLVVEVDAVDVGVLAGARSRLVRSVVVMVALLARSPRRPTSRWASSAGSSCRRGPRTSRSWSPAPARTRTAR